MLHCIDILSFWSGSYLQEFFILSFQKLVQLDVGFFLLADIKSIFSTNMDDFKYLINQGSSDRVIRIRKLTDVVVVTLLSWIVSGYLQRQLHLLLQITQVL